MEWPQTPPLEIAARVAAAYFALFVMIRLAGKREVGQLTPIDLLGMLLLSETVSPVLTAGDSTLAGGLLAAAVLLACSVGVSRVAYWFPRAERWIDGAPTLLIENGRIVPGAKRAERITLQEIGCALRSNGLETIEQVERAVVETNGEITIIPRAASGGEPPSKQ